MFMVRLRNLFASDAVIAAGATLGMDHFAKITAMLPSAAGRTGTVVAIDFEGIEDATPSYVKATVLALHQCGCRYANVLTADEQQEIGDAIMPLDVAVVITNANDAVSDCIHEVFSCRGLAILAGATVVDDQLVSASVLGSVEPAAFEALEVSCHFSEFQAADLVGHPLSSTIKVTGWNNRLAELHRHRLLRRRTEGRTHRFIPLARKVEAYGQVLS